MLFSIFTQNSIAFVYETIQECAIIFIENVLSMRKVCLPVPCNVCECMFLFLFFFSKKGNNNKKWAEQKKCIPTNQKQPIGQSCNLNGQQHIKIDIELARVFYEGKSIILNLIDINRKIK